MNTQLKLLGAALALSFGSAHAGTITTGGQTALDGSGQVTNRPGVCTVIFNGGTQANTCGATYTEGTGSTAASSSHFRTGSVGGQYAAPTGDTTGYFTVGPTDGTPVTITLDTPANYFGFYAGSLDRYNQVQFLLNGVQVDMFTGSDIDAVAFPGTSPNGSQTAFINYFASSFYNSIVYSSTSNAFETDNHAFGIASIPEPTSVALFGLGALALVLGQRRRKS